jgi:hypothetical protein
MRVSSGFGVLYHEEFFREWELFLFDCIELFGIPTEDSVEWHCSFVWPSLILLGQFNGYVVQWRDRKWMLLDFSMSM